MNYIFFVFSLVIFSGVSLQINKSSTISLDTSISVKGISSLLVVLYHCSDAFSNPISFCQVGYLSVSCFFFLSAYGLFSTASRKMNNAIQFWKTRLTKILIPFLVACILYYVVNLFILKNNGPFSIVSGLTSSSDLVLYSWFVWVLFIFYVFSYAIFFFFKTGKKVCFIFLSFLVLIFSILEKRLFPFCGSQRLYSNLAYLLGAFIALFDEELKLRRFYLLCSPIIIVFTKALMIIISKYYDASSDCLQILTNNITSSFAALFAISILSYLGAYKQLSCFLGKISYEVYLYHGMIILLIQAINYDYNFWSKTIAVIFMTIGISIPLHWLDSRIIDVFLKKHPVKET